MSHFYEKLYEKAEKFLDEEKVWSENVKDFLVLKKFKKSFEDLNFNKTPLIKYLREKQTKQSMIKNE